MLDSEEVGVDLVVEGDPLVGELAISLLERADRSADGAEDALPHLLELRLDLLERRVDRHPTQGTTWHGCACASPCHHFVSTSQRRRIPPSAGSAVPSPPHPEGEETAETEKRQARSHHTRSCPRCGSRSLRGRECRRVGGALDRDPVGC